MAWSQIKLFSPACVSLYVIFFSGLKRKERRAKEKKRRRRRNKAWWNTAKDILSKRQHFNKLDELKLIVCANPNIDIICLNETPFNRDILAAEIDLNGYIMFRNDRNFKLDKSDSIVSGGGGSIIYVKCDLDNSLCNKRSNKTTWITECFVSFFFTFFFFIFTFFFFNFICFYLFLSIFICFLNFFCLISIFGAMQSYVLSHDFYIR